MLSARADGWRGTEQGAHPCQSRGRGQAPCLVHGCRREPLRGALPLQRRALVRLPVRARGGRRVQALHRSLGRLMRGIGGSGGNFARGGGKPPRPAEPGVHKTRLCTLDPLAARQTTLCQQAASRRLPGRPLQRRESTGGSRSGYA